MKKKVSLILLLFVVMVSAIGCQNKSSTSKDTTPTEANQHLEFKAIGEYNMPGFGKDFFIYRFDAPNDDIIVYKISDYIYLLGEDAGEKGTSYADIFIEDSQFIALSDKYLLFMTENGKMAVKIEGNLKGDGTNSIQFNGLSDEEKEAFIYPISYEHITQ